MSAVEAIELSFRRSLPSISSVVLISALTMLLSTAYYMTAISPSDFSELPKTREYENMARAVTRMDPWTRTQQYWANNITAGVAGGIGSLVYTGLNITVSTSHFTGIAVTYVSHRYGGEAALAFLAQIYLHGLLELTGLYLIAAGGLRLAWNVWIFAAEATLKYGSGKPRKKNEPPAHTKLRTPLVDFFVLFLLGIFMIFLAAPIEAYVSSEASIFYEQPATAIGFLIMVGAIYGSIVALGLKGVKNQTEKTVRYLRSKKFSPVHVAFVVLLIFFGLGIFRVIS
ncbi:MAG: stage II sporulation protein M [Candidatus Hadarchaeales archaeon]